MNRRGTVTIMIAAGLLAMVMTMGMGIDLARAYLVQSRLQTALDAAALVAAREIDLDTRNADTAAMFWLNFAQTHKAEGRAYFGGTADDPAITQVDPNTVHITTTAHLSLVFGALFGMPTVTISDQAQAVRATTGLEVALVLDNTGSMAGEPIQAVRDASTSLVNILYGSGNQDTIPNLWVSVVPFTAEINIGSVHSSWLASGSLNQTRYANTSWMGCVMARHSGGHDADDATPSAAPFTPFYYTSTLGAYRNGSGKVVPGDDDWSATMITEQNQANLPSNTAVGPDLGCVPLPILPLTASRSAVLSVISQMAAIYRGGTFINLGLQGGWFTLSPKWRGLWGSPTLPLDYNTPHMRKVVVLMTDGDNGWYSWPGGAPDNQGDADYTSYGRVNSNALNTSASGATTALNTSMASMCTSLKQAGITLYAILYNHSAISSDTQTLFQNCASTPEDYFLAPTESDLQTAFSAIGSQLASLRLSQ